ncbi:hypothetical protein OIDMADRAFT_35373 [Oidiodendron maius Zn]|uniref:Uncharacterized protein n=1 Tax=Oidiodendron maius (strain Zn) TaxID=913774 RepID=A0A0C3CW31_OIDMZ|nr:hypothetical protein OIDMADRAFT_35373 [Oidiodendron maius Zn]
MGIKGNQEPEHNLQGKAQIRQPQNPLSFYPIPDCATDSPTALIHRDLPASRLQRPHNLPRFIKRRVVVAKSKHLEDFGALFDDVYPVEFRIGADGRVTAVGVGWEENMREEKIWL